MTQFQDEVQAELSRLMRLGNLSGLDAVQLLINDPASPEIHVSDITNFLACRRAWGWTSPHRANLEPRRPYMPFLTGRAVHLCIERFLAYGEMHESILPAFLEDELDNVRWRATTDEERKDFALMGADLIPDKVPNELWAEIAPQVDEQMTLVRGMMDHYYEWEHSQKGPFSYKNLEPITMEQAFRVPILDASITPDKYWDREQWTAYAGAVFAGRFDGIVRRRDNGQVYIREDKTTRAIPSRAKLLQNEYQPTSYSYAFKLMFPELANKFSGMLYTLLSKRVPKMPRVLNSGYLSTDVKDQSLESYMRAIKAHHGEDVPTNFIAAHYGPTILSLHNSRTSNNIFFERHIVQRTDYAIHQFQQQLGALARDMANPDLPLYPTPGYQCNYCLAYEPCITLQNDGEAGAAILIDDLYRHRPAHDVDGEGAGDED